LHHIGRKYAHDDPELKKLAKIIKDFLDLSDASGGIANNFPFVTRYLPFLTEKKVLLNRIQVIHQFLGDEIKEHKSTLDPDNPRDFIDTYLIEIQNHKEQNIKSSFTGIFI